MSWCRNRDAALAHRRQVSLDCLGDEHLGFFARLGHGDASGKIGYRRAPGCSSLLEDHGVANAHRDSNPASFITPLSVPSGTSSPGLPATVTSRTFVACLKMRWLPVVRMCRQPFDSSNLIKSRTFTAWPSSGMSVRMGLTLLVQSNFSARRA